MVVKNLLKVRHIPFSLSFSRSCRHRLSSQRAVGMIFISCDAWLAGNGIDLLGVLAFFRERDGHGGYKTSVMPLDFIPYVVFLPCLPVSSLTRPALFAGSSRATPPPTSGKC